MALPSPVCQKVTSLIQSGPGGVGKAAAFSSLGSVKPKKNGMGARRTLGLRNPRRVSRARRQDRPLGCALPLTFQPEGTCKSTEKQW